MVEGKGSLDRRGGEWDEMGDEMLFRSLWTENYKALRGRNLSADE